MRNLLLPLVAALAFGPGAAPGADLARVPDPYSAVESAEPHGAGVLAGFLAVLFEERPTGPPPSEVEFVRSFTDRWGIPCREYVQRVFIGEEEVEASGTVCRAADGSWAMRE
jgi:hypothetical protein